MKSRGKRGVLDPFSLAFYLGFLLVSAYYRQKARRTGPKNLLQRPKNLLQRPKNLDQRTKKKGPGKQADQPTIVPR
ncbi:hypothetical protein EBZ39_10215 [bacterium]|nr:hypothetical protein [bacterium]